jgi:hypothetical protein
MRGWGRLPICKASKPDHELEIRATRNIAKKSKKGSVVGRWRVAKKKAETRKGTLRYEEGMKEEQ